MNFYDKLSPFYDEMISFESRFENEKLIFDNVLKKFPAKTILDGGCGSGYHSILLSSLGRDVTGFDPAEKMIELAKLNSKKYNCEIEFFQTDYLNFPDVINSGFDALFTLGNSFVHLIKLKEIKKTLTNFYNVLNSGGYVCIGIVNYDKVLKTKNFEISEKVKNGTVFHRYYTLNEKMITFHIDISGKKNNQFKTELYSLTSDELIQLASKAGFRNIQLFGNLKLEEYSKYESENIVAFLYK